MSIDRSIHSISGTNLWSTVLYRIRMSYEHHSDAYLTANTKDSGGTATFKPFDETDTEQIWALYKWEFADDQYLVKPVGNPNYHLHTNMSTKAGNNTCGKKERWRLAQSTDANGEVRTQLKNRKSKDKVGTNGSNLVFEPVYKLFVENIKGKIDAESAEENAEENAEESTVIKNSIDSGEPSAVISHTNDTSTSMDLTFKYQSQESQALTITSTESFSKSSTSTLTMSNSVEIEIASSELTVSTTVSTDFSHSQTETTESSQSETYSITATYHAPAYTTVEMTVAVAKNVTVEQEINFSGDLEGYIAYMNLTKLNDVSYSKVDGNLLQLICDTESVSNPAFQPADENTSVTISAVVSGTVNLKYDAVFKEIPIDPEELEP